MPVRSMTTREILACWVGLVIGIDGKHRQIGTFDTIEEAHSAYVEAKRKHHSGCTI